MTDNFGTPLEGLEIPPSVKQKDIDYTVTAFESFDAETGLTTIGKYGIEVKPISRRARKEKNEWRKLLQRYPQLVGLSGMPLAIECQKIQNRALSKRIDEIMEEYYK